MEGSLRKGHIPFSGSKIYYKRAGEAPRSDVVIRSLVSAA